jgi:hypothetical protein
MMVEKAWKLSIDAQNGQLTLPGASVGSPSVCQLPDAPSLGITVQEWGAVSPRFLLTLHYYIYTTHHTAKYA